MHRSLVSLVCRGHGPGDAVAQVMTNKMLRNMESVFDASGTRDNEKRGYAAHFWKNYLLLCDWLPNEQKVQIRGPSYSFMHKEVYGVVAKQAGMYLSYKTWKDCMKEGLVLLAALLPGSDPKKLKASRSARHSKCPPNPPSPPHPTQTPPKPHPTPPHPTPPLPTTPSLHTHRNPSFDSRILGFRSAKNVKIVERIGWTRHATSLLTRSTCRHYTSACWSTKRSGRLIARRLSRFGGLYGTGTQTVRARRNPSHRSTCRSILRM